MRINSELFWSRVNGLATDGCWNWIGYVTRYGYGAFGKPPRRAHRIAFYLATGMKPPVVMHLCDNRRCVNPDHLAAGTRLENMIDMYEKGRDCNTRGTHNRPVGGAHFAVKIDAQGVAELRAAHAAGASVNDLKVRYGLTYQGVRSIITRRTWKHL